MDHLDLEVPARVCFGLLGPNGAGKTTTLRMIYGVYSSDERPDPRVFGMDIESTSAGGSCAARRDFAAERLDRIVVDEGKPLSFWLAIICCASRIFRGGRRN